MKAGKSAARSEQRDVSVKTVFVSSVPFSCFTASPAHVIIRVATAIARSISLSLPFARRETPQACVGKQKKKKSARTKSSGQVSDTQSKAGKPASICSIIQQILRLEVKQRVREEQHNNNRRTKIRENQSTAVLCRLSVSLSLSFPPSPLELIRGTSAKRRAFIMQRMAEASPFA